MDRADVPGAAAEPQPLRLRTMLFFGIGCTAKTIALTLYFMAPPERPRGLLNPEPYLPFSLLAAIATLAILLAQALSRARFR